MEVIEEYPRVVMDRERKNKAKKHPPLCEFLRDLYSAMKSSGHPSYRNRMRGVIN